MVCRDTATFLTCVYCDEMSGNDENSDLLLGSKVVMNMFSVVVNPSSYNVYFDNLFIDTHFLLTDGFLLFRKQLY